MTETERVNYPEEKRGTRRQAELERRLEFAFNQILRGAHATGGAMRTIRQVLAVFVLTRMCASLAFILFDGVSSLLQAVAFTIGLVGLVLVALVIGGMSQSAHASPTACRDLGGANSGPVTAR